MTCAGAVSGAAMVLDAANRPHVALASRDRFDSTVVAAPLRYAVRGPGGWEIETVGGAGEADEWPSLVVDSDGDARASWSDILSGTVRYGERTP